MRQRTINLLSLGLAIPLALGGIYATGLFFGMVGGENWTIGYYGKFNRVRHVIEQMPDVRVVDTWQHHDVTLEDFSFTVVSAPGQTNKIFFGEGSPQMQFSKPQDIEAFVHHSIGKDSL